MAIEKDTPTTRPLTSRLLRELIAGASVAGEQRDSGVGLGTALRHAERARRLIKFEWGGSNSEVHIGCLITARAEFLAAASALDKILELIAKEIPVEVECPEIEIPVEVECPEIESPDTDDAFLRGTRR